MAVTPISVANFEAALGECYDALTALTASPSRANYLTVLGWLARAEAQHSGLAASSAAGSLTVARRNSLDGLAKRAEEIWAVAAPAADRYRFGRLGTSHGRGARR